MLQGLVAPRRAQTVASRPVNMAFHFARRHLRVTGMADGILSPPSFHDDYLHSRCRVAQRRCKRIGTYLCHQQRRVWCWSRNHLVTDTPWPSDDQSVGLAAAASCHRSASPMEAKLACGNRGPLSRIPAPVPGPLVWPMTRFAMPLWPAKPLSLYSTGDSGTFLVVGTYLREVPT